MSRWILEGIIQCAECKTEIGRAHMAPCPRRMNPSFAIDKECECGEDVKYRHPGSKLGSTPPQMLLTWLGVEPR